MQTSIPSSSQFIQMLTRRPKVNADGKEEDIQPDAYNYISASISQLKELTAPAWKQFVALQVPQQVIIASLLASVLLGPLILLSFFLPIIVAGIVGVYCWVFGASVFVSHFESALKEHFSVSEESIQKIHKNADSMKDRAVEVSATVRSNALDILSVVFYNAISYSMKLVECLINLLQKASVYLQTQEKKAKDIRDRSSK